MAAPAGLVISGATGRMGRTVARLAAADSAFEIIGGIDRDASGAPPDGFPSLVTPDSATDLLSRADALIDFSAPEFLRALVGQPKRLGSTVMVVGTTGLGEEENRLLDEAAAHTAVLTAANFSVGVNLLLGLARRAAASLGTDFDVEIVETHHRRKEDAPSGTALALGEAIAAGRKVELGNVRRDGRTGRPGARPSGEIGFHSLRGGDVIGEHQVHFVGDLERLTLGHIASDRALFAAGALRAAHWLIGKSPGRYTMSDVLGI